MRTQAHKLFCAEYRLETLAHQRGARDLATHRGRRWGRGIRAGLCRGRHQLQDVRAHRRSLLGLRRRSQMRSEEHTSELQSLMRNSYADFCLKKKKNHIQ